MKNHPIRRMLAMVMVIAMLACNLPAVGATEYTGVHWEKSDQQVTIDRSDRLVKHTDESAAYDARSTVRVSIVLEEKATLRSGYSTSGIGTNAQAMAYNEQLKQRQTQVASAISTQALEGDQLDVVWNLTLVSNVISANVPYGKIPAIEAVSGVSEVILEQSYQPEQTSAGTVAPQMYASTGMIGSQPVWASGYTGAGSRIAIIDTGTDLDHQSFSASGLLYSLGLNAEEKGMDYTSYLSSLDLMDTSDIEAVLTQLNAYERGHCSASEMYFNEKVPFGFNYVDYNLTIDHDSDGQGSHGSHVASIAAANRYIPTSGGYADAQKEVFVSGVAPDAQILTMKVFGYSDGPYDSDYMAAIEDAILLGADAVNLSLGSNNAGMARNSVFTEFLSYLTTTDTVVAISAGNNSYWAAESYDGYLYSDGVNFDTVGSPGSYTNSLAVASVENVGMIGSYFCVNGRDILYSETYYWNNSLSSLDYSYDGSGTEYEYIFIDGIGDYADYDGIDLSGKVVFCSRGSTNFSDKANTAVDLGALAVVVYNNVPGLFSMDLTDYYYYAPCVAITQEDANAIRDGSQAQVTSGGLTYYTGTMSIHSDLRAGAVETEYYTMSDFSSWGVPGNLSLKPEITAPGGNIYAVNGMDTSGTGYEVMSGTSMAAPHVTGMAALVSQYLEETGKADSVSVTLRALTQSLLMSTAQPLFEEASGGNYYSLLNQGAGLARVDLATSAESYILVKGNSDGKVKAELGDDPNRTGKYSFTFTINNLSGKKMQYSLYADMFTQDIFGKEYTNGMGYLDTWTRMLAAETTFYVGGKALSGSTGGYDRDLNNDGTTNAEDADYLLEYLLGNVQTLYADGDLDGDGTITTNDAHVLLAGREGGEPVVTVPANGSVTIDVTLSLTAETKALLDADYPTGAYIEAFVYAEPLADSEGNLGVTHSIPVLGYYGSWTEPSMYDEGTFWEAYQGTLDKVPYLYYVHNGYTNSLTVNYGDEYVYWFGGNPHVDEAWYDPGRSAFNNESGYYITSMNATLIRNAQEVRVEVVNADTGEVYYSKTDSQCYAAYYDPYWGSYMDSLYEFDMWLTLEGVPEDTRVEVRMAAAPEYYRIQKPDGSYTTDWNTLEEGAYLRQEFVIDNTAPEIFDVALNPDGSDSLVVTAKDNRHISAVLLMSADGSQILDAVPGDQAEANTGKTFTLDLTGLYGDRFQVVVCDYADNRAVYDITLERESERPYFTMIDYYYGNYIGLNSSGTAVDLAATGDRYPIAAEYVEGYVFEITENSELLVAPNDDLYSFKPLGKLDPDNDWSIVTFLDIAYNRADGKLYGLFYSDLNYLVSPYLCTIDVHSGEMEVLGEMPVDVQNLAIDGEGNFYSTLYNSSSMYTYTSDVIQTCVVSYVGDMGYYATSNHDSIAWDHNTDELYRAYPSTLLKVDPATASPTLVTYFTAEYTSGLFIAYEPENDLFKPTSQVDAIAITGATSTLPGHTTQLTAIITPWYTTDASVTWSSSNPAVATVDSAGLVTGVSQGTTTITATSVADPGVKATCVVTVKAIETELKGLVWDEDGEVLWSSISISQDPGYTRLDWVDNIYLATTMLVDGTLYAATLDFIGDDIRSDLYIVDPNTYALSYVGYTGYGYMDMAYSPSSGCFVSVYAGNIMFNNLSTGQYEDYMTLDWSGKNLVGIAYYGTRYDPDSGYDVDYFLILDDQGNVHLYGFYKNGYWHCVEGVPRGYLATIGRPVDMPYYQGFYYDGNFAYWTRLGYDDNQVELIVWDCDGSGDAFSLGYFPEDVWPVSGLYSEDTIRYDMPLLNSVSSLAQSSVSSKPVPAEPVLISNSEPPEAQITVLPATPKTSGGPTAVIPHETITTKEEAETESRDVISTESVQTTEATASGIVKLEYDAQLLEVLSVSGNTEAFAWTVRNGCLEIAYASGDVIPQGNEIASVTFRSRPGGDHTVSVTHTQLGSQTVAIADSFTVHGHAFDTAVTEPTCTEQGYTVYTCPCGETFVSDYIEAPGHTYDAVVTPPTCTEQGYTTYTCHCGDSYVAGYVDAAGHTYDAVVTPATCIAEGYTTYTCHCGDSYVADYTGLGGHSYEDSVCTLCGEWLFGDVNSDGKVDAIDAYYIILYYSEQLTLSDNQLFVADVDGNGRIDTADAQYILLFHKGQLTAFPAENH